MFNPNGAPIIYSRITSASFRFPNSARAKSWRAEKGILEGSQDYDLVLGFVEQTKPERIKHIPHVLYHWRAIPAPSRCIRSKNYAHENARGRWREHLCAWKKG